MTRRNATRIALLSMALMAAAAPASGRQPRLTRKARLIRLVKTAMNKITRLPQRVRDRMSVHHEVTELLEQHPHLSRLPLRGRRTRLRLTLGRADRLTKRAHLVEGPAFVAGKAIPDPVLQTGYLLLEGVAFAGVEKLNSQVMEMTLLEAERHYPLYQTPLSKRALRWLHRRLLKRLLALRVKGLSGEAERHKIRRLLKQVERELAERRSSRH